MTQFARSSLFGPFGYSLITKRRAADLFSITSGLVVDRRRKTARHLRTDARAEIELTEMRRSFGEPLRRQRSIGCDERKERKRVRERGAGTRARATTHAHVLASVGCRLLSKRHADALSPPYPSPSHVRACVQPSKTLWRRTEVPSLSLPRFAPPPRGTYIQDDLSFEQLRQRHITAALTSSSTLEFA